MQASLVSSLLGLIWAEFTRKALTGLYKIGVNLLHSHNRNLEIHNVGLVWLLHKVIKATAPLLSLRVVLVLLVLHD